MFYQTKPEIVEAILYDGSEESLKTIEARYHPRFTKLGPLGIQPDGWLTIGIDECEPNCYIIFDEYISIQDANTFEKKYQPTTLHLCDK